MDNRSIKNLKLAEKIKQRYFSRSPYWKTADAIEKYSKLCLQIQKDEYSDTKNNQVVSGDGKVRGWIGNIRLILKTRSGRGMDERVMG